jgi:hypothetical protein
MLGVEALNLPEADASQTAGRANQRLSPGAGTDARHDRWLRSVG